MKTRRPLLALSTFAAVSLCGCGLLKTAVEAPGRVASAAMHPGAKATTVDPSAVQARLMRFADLFAVEITNATREFAQRAGTTEARIQALSWRLDYTNALWRLAAGPRPFAGLFDAIVAITALRAAHEERWLAQWGEADRPMIEALLRLEQSVWSLAGEGLNEAQLGEVRTIVATWLQGDPASRVTDISKLPGFVDLAGSEKSKSGLFGELTNLMSVDPLAGLEPAVREVEQTRQLAERVFFFFQRVPELLSARVELLVLRATQTPEMLGTLASLERVSEAATSIAATAEALPATFSAEREAALTQISRELTAQRAGLVHDIETAQEPVTEILDGTRQTAEAAQALTASLTETLRVLDAFMARFDKDAAEPSAVSEPASAPGAVTAEPAGRPFDITEYGAAAERIGAAVRELGTTIATLDKSLPEVQRVLEVAAARGDRSLDHAFARALQLLAAALGGAAVTVLLVRRISLRWKESSGRAG